MIKIVIDPIDLNDTNELIVVQKHLTNLLKLTNSSVRTVELTETVEIPLEKIPVQESEENKGEILETVEYDSERVVWDSKIHAATKAKTKDGKWRKIREVKKNKSDEQPDTMFTQEELTLPVPAPRPQLSDDFMPAPEPIKEINTEDKVAEFIKKITENLLDKKIKNTQVNKMLKEVGLEYCYEIYNNPQLIPQLEELLQGLINET